MRVPDGDHGSEGATPVDTRRCGVGLRSRAPASGSTGARPARPNWPGCVPRWCWSTCCRSARRWRSRSPGASASTRSRGAAQAHAYAERIGAAVAVGRTEVSARQPYSLSPAALAGAPVVSDLVLPSPNGSAISAAAAATGLPVRGRLPAQRARRRAVAADRIVRDAGGTGRRGRRRRALARRAPAPLRRGSARRGGGDRCARRRRRAAQRRGGRGAGRVRRRCRTSRRRCAGCASGPGSARAGLRGRRGTRRRAGLLDRGPACSRGGAFGPAVHPD